MAQNSKNRRAIFTILCVRRINVFLGLHRIQYKSKTKKGIAKRCLSLFWIYILVLSIVAIATQNPHNRRESVKIKF